MQITIINLKKSIYYFLWIIISLSLINCKPPNPFIGLQKNIVHKNDKNINKIVKNTHSEIQKSEKEHVKDEAIKLKKQSVYKKKTKPEKKLNLTAFLNKDISSIEQILGKPNLIIKHNKIKNLQFHFSSCYLDLFFMKHNLKFILKHFETRPSELNSNLKEKKCLKEISKSIKQ